MENTTSPSEKQAPVKLDALTQALSNPWLMEKDATRWDALANVYVTVDGFKKCITAGIPVVMAEKMVCAVNCHNEMATLLKGVLDLGLYGNDPRLDAERVQALVDRIHAVLAAAKRSA